MNHSPIFAMLDKTMCVGTFSKQRISNSLICHNRPCQIIDLEITWTMALHKPKFTISTKNGISIECLACGHTFHQYAFGAIEMQSACM